MRDRLVKLLNAVECDGEETFGNCPKRRDGQCRTVQKLEMCQIGAIADHLLANGVIVPPCKDENTDYKKLYENLLEDFEHALHFAGKNNNVCNFCEHDCGEKGICKGREVNFRCQPKWRGIMKSKGSEE